MKVAIKQIHAWSSKRSYLLTPLALSVGFVADIFTLNRIDEVFDNVILITHLCLVGIAITLLYSHTTRSDAHPLRITLERIARFIVPFSLGGLLSGFVVFYGRSASLSVSWIMLLLLVLLMISTETMKSRYRRLSVQISVYYLAILLYLIFFFPVIFHTLGVGMFLLSTGASLVVLSLFVALLSRINAERIRKIRSTLVRSVTVTTGVLIILYFTNLIPPIPLSLSFHGVYHEITPLTRYEYRARYEPTPWWNIISKRSTRIHWQQGDEIFVFTSIFAPTRLDTNVIHVWEEKTHQGWQTRSQIPLSISGGRQEGFRTFSKKSHLTEGRWRVRVENKRGQVLGIVYMRIIPTQTKPVTKQETL